ncbi:Protein FAR1-RELATED SEQUENCE [Abeliophyllum distichum]|uniref:Protein FAR1-RELATED SEQUENCE n=1 Tax=Abeliophyllum distichum TaxID=126358 RepID=A0ABD1NUN3_9LAMI
MNDVIVVLERYILRRWRKDVSRTYTMMKINYNGWISTLAQVQYDELCDIFGNVADVVVDDEVQTQEIKKWLQLKMNDLNISKNRSACGSNLISGQGVQLVTERGSVEKESSIHMLDPKCSKANEALRKL